MSEPKPWKKEQLLWVPESEQDQSLLDAFLSDPGFQDMVEADIGTLMRPVQVDWPNNAIRFFGLRKSKEIKIDATLAVLREKIQ